MEIGIFNQTNEEIEEIKTIKEVLESAVKREKLENVIFNVIFVSKEEIHQLNLNYRGIDRVTDVITFALEDDKSCILKADFRVLGDIYICLDKAKEQSIEYNHSLLRELAFLAVHGFYHLLGYDHETKEEEIIMFKKQEEVLEENGIKR